MVPGVWDWRGRKRGECGGADSDETVLYLDHSDGYMNPHMIKLHTIYTMYIQL